MICPECGAVNEEDALRCAKCGKDISPRALDASEKVRSRGNSEEALRKERKMSSLGKWVMVVGLVIYALGFVIWAYANHNLLWFDMGDDLKTLNDMKEWGSYLEGIGTVLAILGLVFLASTMEKMWRRLFDRKP